MLAVGTAMFIRHRRRHQCRRFQASLRDAICWVAGHPPENWRVAEKTMKRVPEGRPTIARRFNAGLADKRLPRPIGTLEIAAGAMPHTYVSDLVHCVFSTKELRKLIRPETQSDLWSFIGGIARKNGFKALIVGGTEDHVHILLSLLAVMPLAKAVQLLKGAPSRWMNETLGKGFS